MEYTEKELDSLFGDGFSQNTKDKNNVNRFIEIFVGKVDKMMDER